MPVLKDIWSERQLSERVLECRWVESAGPDISVLGGKPASEPQFVYEY